jgi:hypothetical protein
VRTEANARKSCNGALAGEKICVNSACYKAAPTKYQQKECNKPLCTKIFRSLAHHQRAGKQMIIVANAGTIDAPRGEMGWGDFALPKNPNGDRLGLDIASIWIFGLK